MVLDACVNACTALKETFGPSAIEWFAFAVMIAAGWWKARKVQSTAQAGIAAASEQASKAKAEARDARMQIARIEGSLRPAALTPMPPAEASSSSGTFQPVIMPDLPEGAPRPRPSMPEPDLSAPTFPRPSAVPASTFDDRPTPSERPGGK